MNGAVLPDPVSSLRVLLTGATSQIGQALLPLLRAEGCEVTALSRKPPKVDGAGIQWRRADLVEGWPEVGPLDVVISFGPMQALAEALAGLQVAPCRGLVATSSMSAKSKQDSVVAEDRALSAALRSAEAALIAECKRLNMSWTILRPTMIYGLGIDENLSPIARRALRTRLFPYPRGRGLRQPVHAGDVALAAWRAANTSAANGQIIEIGGGERLRIDEMFRRLLAALPNWTLPLPLPESLLRIIATLRPGLRGALSRVNQDLIADNQALEDLLDVAPRGFTPEVTSWMDARP